MARLTILALSVLLIVGSTLGTSLRNFVWFPTDNGGVVPAFLEESPDSLEPMAPNPDNIHLYLHTHNNKNTPDELFNFTQAIDDSHWDRDAPVKVYAHGFSSSHTGGSAGAIKKGYIDDPYPNNVNLILVDWKSLAAAPWYDVAAEGTRLVGQKTAYLLSFLVANGYTTADKIHFGGHSLGAHVAGFAGADFQKLAGGQKLGRISGHDPALPRFGAAPDEGRLDPTDAAFVDVIHTASGTLAEGELAFLEPRGHVDFYPNKGRNQPGCVEVVGECSHSRCYAYYVESFRSNTFTSCKCNDNAWDPESNDKFTSCNCANGSEQMGEWVPNTARGIYYLTTNSRAPWSKG